MPVLQTAEFGPWPYEEGDIYHFPVGLPGFEDQRRFLLGQLPYMAPLLVLQSVDRLDLRFYALPMELAAPGFRLTLSAEERDLLRIPGNTQPEYALGLLTWREGVPPTVNLLGPVVLVTRTRRGLQSIQFDSGYSCCHPLGEPAAAVEDKGAARCS